MKLKAGVSATLLANIIFAASQWAIIAGLNYSGNTNIVGQYAYSIAVAGLFLTFGQLGLRQYLLSSIVSEEEMQYIFQVRMLTSILAFLILVSFSYFFLSPLYILLIFILGLMKVFENLSDICHGYFQKNFQIQQIVYSRVFRAISSPILFLIIFHFTQDIAFASAGLFLSLAITFYFFDKKVLIQQNVQFLGIISYENLEKIVIKSAPMGVATLLVILVVNIPLFVLKSEVSDTTLGMYASIFYFVTAGSLVLQSAMQVISPLLTKNIKESSLVMVKSLIIKSYIMAGVFGLIGVLLAITLGDFVLSLLYGKTFENLGELLIIASLINFVLAFQSVGGVVLTSFGAFKYQMYCMLIAIPVCYFSSLILVAEVGINGALYSGAITSFVIALLFLIHSLKKLKDIEKN